MDLERAQEFIIATLADVVERQQVAEVRAARTDRQIRGLQDMVKTGVKMLVRVQQSQRNLSSAMSELSSAMAELATQQKRTDQKFERWLDSMNKGQNGHKKRTN
jgi:hypothetical protein